MSDDINHPIPSGCCCNLYFFLCHWILVFFQKLVNLQWSSWWMGVFSLSHQWSIGYISGIYVEYKWYSIVLANWVMKNTTYHLPPIKGTRFHSIDPRRVCSSPWYLPSFPQWPSCGVAAGCGYLGGAEKLRFGKVFVGYQYLLLTVVKQRVSKTSWWYVWYMSFLILFVCLFVCLFVWLLLRIFVCYGRIQAI